MNQPRAASAAVASPHVARSTAGPPDVGVGGGGADIGANIATGKSASACTVGAGAGACTVVSGGQYLFLCFLCPARLGGAAPGAGAGDHGLGAGADGIGAGDSTGGGSSGDEVGVVGAGRSATSTTIFMPPRQCPGAPQMK